MLEKEVVQLKAALEEQQRAGHRNPRQPIRYYDNLKAENALLKKEVENLRKSNLNYVIASGKVKFVK